jgi:hypothetical protein
VEGRVRLRTGKLGEKEPQKTIAEAGFFFQLPACPRNIEKSRTNTLSG